MLHVYGHQRIASGKQRTRNNHCVMDRQPIFLGELQADIRGLLAYRHDRANAAQRREHLADFCDRHLELACSHRRELVEHLSQ